MHGRRDQSAFFAVGAALVAVRLGERLGRDG